ncbi:MAG: hypothetical protein GY926_11545 [bacterium]|nr:hypothetical protein [bacterium]
MTRPRTFAILGGSFSGNKGAASMTYAVCDGVRGHLPDAKVLIFSPYPTQDRLQQESLEIVDLTPRTMILRVLPAALLSLLTMRKWRPKRGTAGLLANSDVVADVSGIAFMDGRGLATLIYNTLLVFLPWALGVPIVKIAQALGPFNRVLNRVAARFALRRVDWIGLRGHSTATNVARLGLDNAEPASDIAFLLEADEPATQAALSEFPQADQITIVMPSAVVEQSCAKDGIDYVARMADLVGGLTEAGHEVVVIAHSARAGAAAGRTNDLPVCRSIAAASAASMLDREIDAKELRALVDRSRLLVTSRFHGMISGLATHTPTFVVGWSHKYREVLDDFELADWVVDFRELSGDALLEAVLRLDAEGAEVRSRIDEHLARVLSSAETNLNHLLAAAGVRQATELSDLSPVLENDLCIGCGACVAADPTVSLGLHPEKLIFEPTHPGNELAAAVCPAIGVDYATLQGERFPGAEPGAFGVVESVTLAQSIDIERNRQASSGGIIKELLTAYLERDDVDGVIALGHVEGLEFEPRLIRAVAQVDELPGSIYHNLPKHRVLDLLREHEGRYVLVAIPCELEGIFSYISKVEPHLANRIHATVGLLCGWQYSHHALRAICEFKGIDADRIADVSYRGGGPVGKLRITTHEGDTAEVNRRVDFSYQVAFDRHFNTPRCHLCINHANFLADVVVGDAWLPSTVGTKTGISIVISRTAAADGMLRHLASTERIVLTDVSTAEIEESQTRRIAFGDFAYAYADHLRSIGRFVPDLQGPNLPHHKPVPRPDLVAFHRELDRKLELQRAGRYRFLRWRKGTKELPRFLQKYVRWFLVRIVRIKSLTGERHEIARDELSDFR